MTSAEAFTLVASIIGAVAASLTAGIFALIASWVRRIGKRLDHIEAWQRDHAADHQLAGLDPRGRHRGYGAWPRPGW